jgi:hypothetical protein
MKAGKGIARACKAHRVCARFFQARVFPDLTLLAEIPFSEWRELWKDLSDVFSSSPCQLTWLPKVQASPQSAVNSRPSRETFFV